MNVLSLFDGMSCGRIALERCGIKVDKYFASELDKYAMTVSKANYPDIIQLGDVKDVTFFGLPKIDLLIGGSPCQGFSMAGKQLNFEDPRSKLFFEFVRLKDELQPKYFLLENVKMKKESMDVITKYMGVESIEINSSLVSAQNRKRLYWTNIPGIKQPEDKGILLKDILEDGSEKIGASRGRPNKEGTYIQQLEIRKDDKSNTITSATKDNLVIKEATKKGYAIAEEGGGVDLSFPNSKTRRGRVNKGKAHSLMGGTPQQFAVVNETATKGGKSHCVTARYSGAVAWNSAERSQRTMVPIKEEETDSPNNYNGLTYRKLTPLECERLQTVPDHYSNHVSNSQRYKMLGNGWTIDVISHIFKNIKQKNK